MARCCLILTMPVMILWRLIVRIVAMFSVDEQFLLSISNEEIGDEGE